MKKLVAVAIVGGLLAAGLALPAQAKKKAKPVKTTFYLHGVTAVGENDSMSAVNDVMLPMDTIEPTATEPKSKQITNGVATPNHMCAGNNLFPNWSGKLVGRVVRRRQADSPHSWNPRPDSTFVCGPTS